MITAAMGKHFKLISTWQLSEVDQPWLLQTLGQNTDYSC